MQSLTVTQHARPLRIAFLVDKNSYLDAVRFNTALWGGIFNPIIPVKKTDSQKERNVALAILKEFDPDFIINLTSHRYPYIDEAFSNNHPTRRVLTRSEFFGRNPQGDFEFRVGLTVLPIFKTVWERETKAMRGKSNAFWISNKNYPDWNNFTVFTFGSFVESFNPDFREVFLRAVKPQELDFTPELCDRERLLERPCPITITDYELDKFFESSAASSHIIYVGSLNKWRDFVEFWNLRALGKEVVFLPFEVYMLFPKAIEGIIQRGNYPINERIQNEADLLKSESITEEQLKEVQSWIRTTTGANLALRMFPLQWGRESRFVVKDVAACSLRNAESEEAVILADGEVTPFVLVDPTIISNFRAYKENVWANVVNFSGYFGSEYCFTFPRDENVEKLVQRELLAGKLGKARLSKQGIVVYRDYQKDLLRVSPVEAFSVLEALLKTAKLKIKPSQPGIMANTIIKFLGGLEDCRVFKLQGIREALKELNFRGELEANEIMGIIGRNWKPEYNDLVLYFGQGRPLDSPKTFQYLVDKKLVTPGLKFRCSQCNTEEWYGVGNFNEKFTCQYCSCEQDIPRLDTLKWHYKSNLVARFPAGGFGSIPVILSLWRYSHLPQLLRNSQGFTSTIIQHILDSSFERELDYFHLITDRDGKYELILGEAKELSEFKREDVRKIKEVASRFPFKPYLSFTTLKDELSSTEKIMIKRLSEAGFPVVVLTRKELDPYDLYDRFENAPHKYAVTLEEFAENTRVLNLEQ